MDLQVIVLALTHQALTHQDPIHQGLIHLDPIHLVHVLLDQLPVHRVHPIL